MFAVMGSHSAVMEVTSQTALVSTRTKVKKLILDSCL